MIEKQCFGIVLWFFHQQQYIIVVFRTFINEHLQQSIVAVFRTFINEKKSVKLSGLTFLIYTVID